MAYSSLNELPICTSPCSIPASSTVTNFLVIVQLLSHVQLFVTPWTKASLSFTISQSLLKLMSIKSVMPSNCLILCRPLLLPSIFPSIRVFSNESALRIRWPKYWTSASVLPMNIQGWFPLGLTYLISLLSKALKTLLQHHSLKASFFWHSAFFIVQLTFIHDYWKNHSFDYMDLCQ